ncbi:uncharacterized protein [Misgurnus anguillicaudatus]|uniref:uncharacterized protein isoform X8 n=1 Tax=Misgurnus anguillicaudatus TaxID=75329 RepID=UPI0024360F45|nr:uncharacterized protein LOC129431288 isoform X9 [Misgurnus anguillicaudatus]XP_055045754.1 uncharacterized protein LOC129431288 isoform X10 [Misgurnus anguillicaudatus]
MNNLETLKSQGLHSDDVLGTIGPFKIYLGSLEALLGPFEIPDEVMNALFLIMSRSQPGTEAINSQAMGLILEGSSRARSTYFLKKNILKEASAVFGPYLVGECHWTLFHCNLKEGTITYIDSLGEQPQRCFQIIENWSLFAASRGCQGPWKLIQRDHDLQNDSVSCGMFAIMFAEMVLQGQEGHLQCLPIAQERERLGTLLINSLDTKTLRRKKGKIAKPKNTDKPVGEHPCAVDGDPAQESESTECKQVDGDPAQESESTECEQTLFEVESVLRLPDGTKAKRYKVTREELVRRCGPPEGFSPNALVAYLRKGKSQKEALMAKLHDSQVEPGPRIRLSTSVSKLCEEECLALAEDLNYMGFKYLPIQKIGQACLEEDHLEAIVKAQHCRQTLTRIKTAMEANWSDYNLATHGLGPEILKGAFSLIDACLVEAENLHCFQK